MNTAQKYSQEKEIMCVLVLQLMFRETKERKKHSRKSPDAHFKEFSLTKQRTRRKTDYK